MKHISALVLVSALAVFVLSGCSVAMASKKRGVDVAEIMACRTQACIRSLKDTEELETVENEKGQLVTYRSLQKQGSAGRAAMHGLLDVDPRNLGSGGNPN